MVTWLKWRLVAPVFALVMALAPVACVLHCQAGAQVQMVHAPARLLGQSFMPDCGMTQPSSNPAPLNDMQQTYEQVTQALAPAGVTPVRVVALAQARLAVMPILRQLALAPETPPPKITNYELLITNSVS
ncbi:MAG TPA: hypothetical protein PLJ62_04410 [Thermoflexales bacterium]|nr:hypothetical protein [Thermoflexales bacterium]HQW34312.1 hypothetical protein [Thermoflexales bacterium]HQZ22083.1 hypothetical protein [Thermoflexales bacterium]HQZ99419.1 hypothetical protein [Thermoflexales bacterium]